LEKADFHFAFDRELRSLNGLAVLENVFTHFTKSILVNFPDNKLFDFDL